MARLRRAVAQLEGADPMIDQSRPGPRLEDDDERLDPEEEFRRARAALSSRARGALRAARALPVLAIIALGIWAASGVYVVNPGEQGVVRHFGREIAKSAPGLNYHVPSPIQSVDVVNVQAIRRIEVGFRSDRGRVPAESLMLTGDENIVDTQLIVQYRVRDPSLFLFRMRDPEGSLHQAAQVAIRSVVGNTSIEDVLTTGRAQAQEHATGYIQTLMDQYESGLLITEVKLQVVDPPDQVKDAFNEVVRAREDRERQQNEAQAYMEDIVPKARGEAEQVIRAADAFRQERVFQAQGDVARFRAVLDEYRKGRDVTRERLYLETIERVLGKVGKVVVDKGVGDRTLPLLPLNDLVRGTGQAGPQPQAVPAQPPAQTQQQQPSPTQPSSPGPTPAAKPSR
jgi:modulator of FtsH protease HflK